MYRTPLDILNLFVEFPGDLLFFLMVIAFSQGALFLAYGHRSRFPYEPAARRYLIASAGLVVVWLAMLGAVLLAMAASLEANRFMPPLERLAYAVSASVLAWAFLSGDMIRWRNWSNALVIVTALVLAALYLFSAAEWLDASLADSAFNASSTALLWSALLAAIAVLGGLLALLNINSIVDAPLKSVFFLALALGNSLDLAYLSQGETAGSYLGGARLAYVAGLALFPLIIHRFSVALLENSLVEVVLAASQPSSALSQTPADALSPAPDPLPGSVSSWNFAAAPTESDSRKLLSAIGMMLDAHDALPLPEQVVRATLEALSADVCILLRVEENQYADVTAGYDRVADSSLSGLSLNLRDQPTLLEASKRGEQTILFPEYHEAELADLFRRLSLSPLSKVYVQPLAPQGESFSVLLVALPYRQADLSIQDIESLRDIGAAAAHILAWTAANTQSRAQAEAQRIAGITEKTAESAVDLASLTAKRQALEKSLNPVVERRARLEEQIADLGQQLQQQQVRILDSLVASAGDSGAPSRLNAAFDEQASLRDGCKQSARDLLEGETVLRTLNIDSGETLVQVIREYLHKEVNLLESARDRLRRQMNAALLVGKSATVENVAVLMQSLADETAQMELERDQQRRRLDSIAGRLESLGFSAEHSNMTQLLIQIHAEREAHGGQLAEVNEDRAALLDQARQLKAADGGDREELEGQLARLSADHEELLNSREVLRREKQRMQSKIEQSAAENAKLQTSNAQLKEQLSAKADDQAAIDQRIKALSDERDNLLTLRDQLKAKVTAAMEEGGASATVNAEIAELRANLSRLTEQREELALALNDARIELEREQPAQPGVLTGAAETGKVNWQAGILGGFLADLRSPLTSLSDYTALLLAESLGILGAAQQQVLRMMTEELGKLAHVLGAIQEAVQLDSTAKASSQGESDIMAVIDEVLRTTSGRLNDKEIQVELALADHLPPVSASDASLRQILTRLVENAAAVSPPGATIKISADASRFRQTDSQESADCLEISVRDHGGGIAEADLPRVFARKYSSAYPSIPGLSETGVSLSIGRAYVRARDGDLWVTSEDDGSVFHIALPVQTAPSLED